MNERYEEIDRYLADEMQERERKVFVERLAEDDALAAEVEALAMARESINRQTANQAEVSELRSIMAQAQKGIPEQRPVVKRLWFRVASGVAAAVVLVLIYVGWPAPETLYEQYAQHPPLEMTYRSAEDQAALTKLETAYQKKEYAEVAILLEAYAEVNGWNTELRLFMGISQLEQNNLAAAEEQFSLLYAGVSANKWAGAYYLALTYLRRAEGGETANWQKCRDALLSIPEGADYFEQARKLLAELPEG